MDDPRHIIVVINNGSAVIYEESSRVHRQLLCGDTANYCTISLIADDIPNINLSRPERRDKKYWESKYDRTYRKHR